MEMNYSFQFYNEGLLSISLILTTIIIAKYTRQYISVIYLSLLNIIYIKIKEKTDIKQASVETKRALQN